MAKQPRTKSELDRLRDIAEDYYIRLGKTGREISEILDISEQTISNWKKGREGEQTWDERRRNAQLTPVRLKDLLMEEARKVVAGEKSEINADQLSKIMAAINSLDKSINPRVVMTVFQDFDNFMAEVNPQKAIEFTEFHKMYLKHIIKLES